MRQKRYIDMQTERVPPYENTTVLSVVWVLWRRRLGSLSLDGLSNIVDSLDPLNRLQDPLLLSFPKASCLGRRLQRLHEEVPAEPRRGFPVVT